VLSEHFVQKALTKLVVFNVFLGVGMSLVEIVVIWRIPEAQLA